MDEHYGDILRLSQKMSRALRDTLQERNSDVRKAEDVKGQLKKRMEKLKLKNVRKSSSIKEKTPLIPLEDQLPSTSTAGMYFSN